MNRKKCVYFDNDPYMSQRFKLPEQIHLNVINVVPEEISEIKKR
jgi:hypothetical protein